MNQTPTYSLNSTITTGCNCEGPELFRYGYQGQFSEYDPETGLNHFLLRDFDSRIGRWLKTDPYNQFYSPYVGMGNNPVSGVDPNGGEYYGAAQMRDFWRAVANQISGQYALWNDILDWVYGRGMYLDASPIVERFVFSSLAPNGGYGGTFSLIGFAYYGEDGPFNLQLAGRLPSIVLNNRNFFNKVFDNIDYSHVDIDGSGEVDGPMNLGFPEDVQYISIDGKFYKISNGNGDQNSSDSDWGRIDNPTGIYTSWVGVVGEAAMSSLTTEAVSKYFKMAGRGMNAIGWAGTATSLFMDGRNLYYDRSASNYGRLGVTVILTGVTMWCPVLGFTLSAIEAGGGFDPFYDYLDNL